MQNADSASAVDQAGTNLISNACDLKSGALLIASEPVEVQERFLNELSEGAIGALPFLFEFWAHLHQLPPEGDWRSWVILGGRGAGKTRAGAEWVRAQVEGATPLAAGRRRSVALLGETYDQVREVMIFGDSGILAATPPDRRPTWVSTRRQLEWPNGARAVAYSASDPEALRGPQFDAAWADELAKWKTAEAAWDMLQFALRLGEHPQACVTTTPRNVAALKTLLALPSTVVTRAPTEANRVNLAESFLKEVKARYAGTRIGLQELEGELLTDVEGAFWTSDMLERGRVQDLPDLDRIVVGVDPAVGGADECGIVVVGAVTQGPPDTWRAYVLADRSIKASPMQWAEVAVAAFTEFTADRIIAEANQGGQMVAQTLRTVDAMVPVKLVHASRGKTVRAEPIAALYEQGRVKHVRGLKGLEDQMVQMTRIGFAGKGSPDRVDALVWALHDLMIVAQQEYSRPGIRPL